MNGILATVFAALLMAESCGFDVNINVHVTGDGTVTFDGGADGSDGSDGDTADAADAGDAADADAGDSMAPTITDLSPLSGVPGMTVTATGTGLGDVASWVHNGIEWEITAQSATELSATVPDGFAFLGPITVTNPAGSADSADFTLRNFRFDLSQDISPPGIVAIRSPAPRIYAADGVGTVRAYDGEEVAEDHGDGLGKGRSSFPGFSGPADPRDFSSGWTLTNVTRTAGAATGPDGAASAATRMADASASTSGQALYAGSSSSALGIVSTLWHRDDPDDVPTSDPAGAIGAYSGNYYAPVPRSSGWRRSASMLAVGSTTYTPRIDLRLTGASPSGAATQQIAGEQVDVTEVASATGSLLVDLHQVQFQKNGLLPVSVGETGALSYQIEETELGLVMDGSGYFQVELDIPTDPVLRQQGNPDGGSYWLLSLDSASGVNGLHWTSGAITRVFNGTDDGGFNAVPLIGQPLRVRLFNLASGRGHQVFTNGCRQPGGGNIPVTLDPPTAGWLGSNLGSSQALARYSRLAKSDADLDGEEGLVLGDSLWSPYSGNIQATCTRIYTPAEAVARTGIVSLAAAGDVYDTTNPSISQTSKWLASPHRGKASLLWVVVAISRNDLINGRTYAQVKADVGGLIEDVNAENPGAVVIVAPIVPSGGTLDATQQGYVDSLNSDVLADEIGGTHTHLPLWTGDYRLGEDDTGAGDDPLDQSDFGVAGESPPVHTDDRGHGVEGASVRARLVDLSLLD